jgi:hypothetical protein
MDSRVWRACWCIKGLMPVSSLYLTGLGAQIRLGTSRGLGLGSYLKQRWLKFVLTPGPPCSDRVIKFGPMGVATRDQFDEQWQTESCDPIPCMYIAVPRVIYCTRTGKEGGPRSHARMWG